MRGAIRGRGPAKNKEKKRGREGGWKPPRTYRGRQRLSGGGGEGGKEEKLAGGAATGLLFSLFRGQRAACIAGAGPEFRDPLWPAFIATTPKGAFIFISIMGHRDVYTARSALSLRSFIIINSAMGPPSPTPIKIPAAVPRAPFIYDLIYLATNHPRRHPLVNAAADLFAPFSSLVYHCVETWIDRSAMQIKEYRF